MVLLLLAIVRAVQDTAALEKAFLKQLQMAPNRKLMPSYACICKLSTATNAGASDYFNLGIIAANRRDMKVAEEYYRTARKLDPTDARFHFNLAFLLQGSAEERFDEAMESYTRTIGLWISGKGKNNTLSTDLAARALNNQGVIFRSQHRFHEAAAAIEKAGKLENSSFFNENLNNIFNHMPSICDNSSTFWSSVQKDETSPNLCTLGVDGRAGSAARILVLGQ